MHPLTFKEFIINEGIDEKVLDYVEESLRNGTAINETVHKSMRALYLQYLIVGGMPEACNAFFATHDITAVRMIQKSILSSIKDDFGRYKDKYESDRINEVLKLKAEACLDSLPFQLYKEYKKFQYSLVAAKGRAPEKADGLQYIEDLGLVIRAYNTKELTFPLEDVKIPTEFKVFSADTGLLTSMLSEDTPAKIPNGDLSTYKGAIAENMVAAAFRAAERELYYHHASSGSPELDFIYEEAGKVIIVECKSTNNRATSMKFVLANSKRFGCHEAIKYADTNIGGGDGFKTYPLYALGFLKKKEKKLIVDAVDAKAINSILHTSQDSHQIENHIRFIRE